MHRVADRMTVVGGRLGLDHLTGTAVVVTDAPEGEGTAADPQTWPASGDLDSMRLQVVGAVRLIESGRYEPGVRTLRRAVGGLARRDDWAHAGEGAIALASALLRRGQPEGAHQVLDRATDYCTRSRRHDLLIDIATLSAEGWIDRVRLDQAEAVIGGALTSARGARDHLRVGIASLALSRCRFWRGRYNDADVALAEVDDQALPIELQVRAARFRAKVAVGRRDFACAMRWASLAIEQARLAANHRLIAAAAFTKAFVYLSLGDANIAAQTSKASIAAARSARDPLRATRARLMLAEIDRRANRLQACAAVVNRLRHMARDCLAPLVRLQCDLLHGLLTASHRLADGAGYRTALTGPEALALYLPEAPTSLPDPAGSDSWTAAIVDILGVCQTAEDETSVLSEICSKVRRQLHAAGVAYVVTEHGALAVVASSGSRIDFGVASRALTAGAPIAPHARDGRIEAAAPVRHSGSVLGALVARWTPGSPQEPSGASTLLTVAANAAAAAVSAVLARRARAGPAPVKDLLGAAPAMAELRSAVERAAAAPFAVLVEGETGSGKELVAQAVHRLGPRRDRPFCAVNCAALPDDLVEAELFGHARGAFTGAVTDRPGVFEEANGGTLFLDEVGELSSRAQAKLLRVVQGGELRRVGENLSRRIDVRIVAATNRDLRQEAAAGHFRSDLLYRLDVIRLSVPPLRHRGEDIAILLDHFWREATARVGSRATLAPTTVAALARYDWPGNVRELQNVTAALAVQCPKRGVVPPTALPAHLVGRSGPNPCRLEDARRMFEERFVRAALARSGGHRSRAAEELGVTRQGLTKLMTRLGISEQPWTPHGCRTRDRLTTGD